MRSTRFQRVVVWVAVVAMVLTVALSLVGMFQ